VAVPGTVAGLALAAERYGTMPRARLIEPAIALARAGFPISWHTSLKAAQELDLLDRYPTTRAIFTRDGRSLSILDGQTQNLLVQRDLARTLEAIAVEGPSAFYRGEIAGKIVDAVQSADGILSRDDLAGYEVRIGDGLWAAYRGRRIVTMPAPSGGPTLLESLRLMEQADLARSGHNTVETLHWSIEAFRQAFADRFAYLGDPSYVDVPVDALLSDDYIHARSAEVSRRARRVVEPGERSLLGVTHDLARSLPGYGAGGNTTHLSTMDRAGNAVSLTQTLLSLWGSFFVAGGTGVLLNNGMMWFDPEPGHPNSVDGGKRPLANMAPALVFEGDMVLLSVGSMGGRKIMNANAQIIANVVDHGFGIQTAITAPRIDCSVEPAVASSRIAAEVIEGLRGLGHRIGAVVEDVGNNHFASPVGIQRAPDGTLRGGANPYYPAMAIGC
jgi:gamma-glutamyltranspeptidase/glutathione hydrolase